LADGARLAEWLGLDPSRFGGQFGEDGAGENQDEAALLTEPNVDVDVKFKDFVTKFTTQWKCPKCKVQFGLITAVKNTTCLKCGEQKIETAHIHNLICAAVRELQTLGLLGWAQCDNTDQCGAHTRQVSVKGNGAHCPKDDCVGGRLRPLHLTSKDMHQHLVYLHELCLKYRPEAASIAQEAIEENAYDTVDLCELFSQFAIKGA
jgi:DNA-directed RNA polymerase subunit RPC12/RpoP